MATLSQLLRPKSSRELVRLTTSNGPLRRLTQWAILHLRFLKLVVCVLILDAFAVLTHDLVGRQITY